MKIKKSLGSKVFDGFNVIFLFFLMSIMIYPIVYVIFASISDSNMLLSHNGFLWKPLKLNFSAYKAVMKNPNILSGYATTLFLVIAGTFCDVFMTCIAAFVLSRREFSLKKILLPLIIFTMYFSGGMIPRYLMISDTLGLGDSLFALILPGLISTWNLIIMKTNFESLPSSLEEAAKIDGANDIAVLFRIVLPLSKAIIAVMVLMYAVGIWNSWFDAMLFIRTREKYPLQIILREILITNDTSSMMDAVVSDVEAIGESIKYATIVISTVPILCVYPFLQKYFAKGVMVGAVKG